MAASFTYFLQLPLELRTLVYNHLLVPKPDGSVLMFRSNFTEVGPREPWGISTSILRANKQVYLEASPILYRSNIFTIGLSLKPDVGFSHCRTEGPESWENALEAYYVWCCTPRCTIISTDTLKRMRRIEILITHEVIQDYSLPWRGYKHDVGKFFIDIIRILAGTDRRTIGANKIISGGDVETGKSLTICVVGDTHHYERSWIETIQKRKARAEKRMRRLRRNVESVEGRRHLEIFESCKPKDQWDELFEDETSEYKPTDIDSIFKLQN